MTYKSLIFKNLFHIDGHIGEETNGKFIVGSVDYGLIVFSVGKQ